MRRLWPGLELAVAAAALVVLGAWQVGGGRVVDVLLGRPNVDERLMMAVAGFDEKQFEAALLAGASAAVRDSNGMTALSYAAMYGSKSRAFRLIQVGAEIDQVDLWGYTPLMHAAHNDHADVVALLLHHGADASRRNANGETAIEAARNMGADRAVSVLASSGNADS